MRFTIASLRSLQDAIEDGTLAPFVGSPYECQIGASRAQQAFDLGLDPYCPVQALPAVMVNIG